MISILVDEGYAYDYLAILSVKSIKLDTPKSHQTLSDCYSHLSKQVGELKHREIMFSEEFDDLVKANLETFDAVEKARYGQISAKEVDDLNMKRYNLKVTLQNRFFPNVEIMETKS